MAHHDLAINHKSADCALEIGAKIANNAAPQPGSRVDCEVIRGSFGKEQPGLLWPSAPRSIVVEATAPRTDGHYRVTATVSPVKYWDSIPGNNSRTATINVANVVKNSDALKGPRYGN